MHSRWTDGRSRWGGIFGLILAFGIGGAVPSHAHPTPSRMQMWMGVGGAYLRYEPLGFGVRTPRESAFTTVLMVEFAPLPGPFRSWVWVGLAGEILNHVPLIYAGRAHQALELRMRFTPSLPVLRYLYGGVGLSWVQVRTFVPERDISAAATGWVPRYFAGLAIPYKRMALRVELAFLKGKIRVKSERFRYRRTGITLALGLQL